jgi:hypothetical protein
MAVIPQISLFQRGYDIDSLDNLKRLKLILNIYPMGSGLRPFFERLRSEITSTGKLPVLLDLEVVRWN